MAIARWNVVAALIDPVRRALYEHVRRQKHAVSREEAADAVAVSRTLTAFHLDKLVDVGLLQARYEAPSGKRRGRGRTPKVYEASADGLNLTIPARQYELAGQILADAIAESPTDALAAVRRQAFRRGQQIGQSARPGSEDRVASLDEACQALAEMGYEPRPGEEMLLDNCPFHALAQRQRELICGLNQAFVEGVLTGLGAHALQARLIPRPGSCCVTVTAAPATD
ncbi:helix-turn-helix transcriptional regulator [Rhizocola hellebori]|uniref:helix-turn-helix transcriptional regulator n=1 Tax=Rhizocola hellebori TaxID=1392758 RepID=UPI0019410A6C|nr:helix-turn-helix domain-containing protein [Rhizocola hellebori]